MNLGVPPGLLDEQGAFLVDVLGYPPLQAPDELLRVGITPHWYVGGDGAQIHLSEDEDHRPAARAHIAIELAPEELDAVEHRLRQAGRDYQAGQPLPGLPHQLLVQDPAGNRWELRCPE